MPSTSVRIVRCTGASFGGSTLVGVVRAGWAVETTRKRGRSDGERGDTTIDKTFFRVRGFVELDSFDPGNTTDVTPETQLLTNALGVLVLNWVTQGGTAKTTTFGDATAIANADVGLRNGVIFVRASGMKIGEGAEAGPTSRIRCEFIAKFKRTDTSLADLIVEA